MKHIGFPYRIDSTGQTAGADHDRHVYQMLEQVLFTAPGERVNRPDFGSGLIQLVFGANSDELATATEYVVQGALQQWLAEVIQIESVQVHHVDARLEITVQYRLVRTQERRTVQFTKEN